MPDVSKVVVFGKNNKDRAFFLKSLLGSRRMPILFDESELIDYDSFLVVKEDDQVINEEALSPEKTASEPPNQKEVELQLEGEEEESVKVKEEVLFEVRYLHGVSPSPNIKALLAQDANIAIFCVESTLGRDQLNAIIAEMKAFKELNPYVTAIAIQVAQNLDRSPNFAVLGELDGEFKCPGDEISINPIEKLHQEMILWFKQSKNKNLIHYLKDINNIDNLIHILAENKGLTFSLNKLRQSINTLEPEEKKYVESQVCYLFKKIYDPLYFNKTSAIKKYIKTGSSHLRSNRPSRSTLVFYFLAITFFAILTFSILHLLINLAITAWITSSVAAKAIYILEGIGIATATAIFYSTWYDWFQIANTKDEKALEIDTINKEIGDKAASIVTGFSSEFKKSIPAGSEIAAAAPAPSKEPSSTKNEKKSSWFSGWRLFKKSVKESTKEEKDSKNASSSVKPKS